MGMQRLGNVFSGPATAPAAARWAASLLTPLLLILFAGCGSLTRIEPAPEYLGLLEPAFTRGIPPELEQPPLRTEGLREHELDAIQVYRDTHRAVVNVTSLSIFRMNPGAHHD